MSSGASLRLLTRCEDPATALSTCSSGRRAAEAANGICIKLLLSCQRKSGRGSVRSSAATPRSSATIGSTLGIATSGSVKRTSMAQSNCSISTGLDIFAPHLGSQSLQAAELKLLDGAFAASQLLRD